jgi:hypothetical protein
MYFIIEQKIFIFECGFYYVHSLLFIISIFKTTHRMLVFTFFLIVLLFNFNIVQLILIVCIVVFVKYVKIYISSLATYFKLSFLNLFV